MVSPANSFGFMDGGLDLAIRERLDVDIQTKIQNEIGAHHNGELPVGQCHITDTGNSSWPRLAVVPTMRIPMDVSGTLNVYYAFRALLIAVAESHQRGAIIRSVLCPGLGTGIGGVNPTNCAGQMAYAFRQSRKPSAVPSARDVLREHTELTKFA